MLTSAFNLVGILLSDLIKEAGGGEGTYDFISALFVFY